MAAREATTMYNNLVNHMLGPHAKNPLLLSAEAFTTNDWPRSEHWPIAHRARLAETHERKLKVGYGGMPIKRPTDST
jgi:hypothetical protein